VTVGSLFGEAARDYDRARRQLVPGFDRFYGATLESVPFAKEQEIKVLELGAGTGLLSAMIAEKFPRSRVTLVDLSVEMLRVARRRFTREPGRFEFRTMDYARKPLPSRNGGYDLIVSALSIHHLTHGDKRELFGKVRRSLAVGGYFVNADQIAGDTLEEEMRFRDWWLGQVREAGISERDLAAALLRMRADRNATLSAQLLWLREAGFGGVDCKYKDHRFAVYGGKKGYKVSEEGKDDDE
jgi:tRNA (cmo5U34)-methyltransferase